MTEIGHLIKRNIMIYRRDKSCVFFSILSTLVLLGLMALFLGKNNTDNLYELMVRYAGENADLTKIKNNATKLIYLWTLSGAIATNGITVPLTIYMNMIADETNGRLQAFYTAPVKRWKITIAYIMSSWVIGFLMCFVTLLTGQVYFAINGILQFSVKSTAYAVMVIIFNTLVYSVIGYTIAIFVHSSSAWSGFLTVAGTLVGFLGGMYLPFGAMEHMIRNIITGLPVIHSFALIRTALMESTIKDCFERPENPLIETFKEHMGISLFIGKTQLSVRQTVVLPVFYMLISLIIGIYATNKRKMK